MLPEAFIKRMEHLLGEDYPAFIESYEKDRAQGLRVNLLKGTKEEFLQKSPFTLTPIPWVEEGFYYAEEQRPGKHPYHEAGVYYIQEPSAMAVAQLAGVQPGEKVLDLCAAPGGKSTQLASHLGGEGFLLSNEIHPARAKILAQNMERMGVRNAVVTNEPPAKLAKVFPLYFDCVVVDAPCSGEGMFRKNPLAQEEWSPEHVAMCAQRQQEVLESGAKMVRPGGRLVYSTCTFAPEENEGVISAFLRHHPEFSIQPVDHSPLFGEGNANWTEEPAPGLEYTMRLWPHRLDGEGHYIAVLRREDNGEEETYRYPQDKIDKTALAAWEAFAKDALTCQPKGKFIQFGDQLYLLPGQMLDMKGLKVLRPGWHLGTLKKNRLEPSHGLALSLRPEEAKRVLALTLQEKEVERYLRGDTLETPHKGWQLVTVDGYSLGWGKGSDGTLKNHYPKGLRWN